jgi:protein phosphatase
VLRAFGISDTGRFRATNEDCFAVDERLGLLVVADGMGGHNAGEVAARMAVDAILDEMGSAHTSRPFGVDATLSPDANRLRTAVLVANLQILEAAIGTQSYAGMGTTIVAARVVGHRLVVAHVGDSRLYLLTASGLTQLTTDDSWVASVLALEPHVDHAILAQHPMRHALTNVVGARSRTDVHVTEHSLTDGDVMLLTTDGVHGVLDERRLARLLDRDAPLNAIAEDVIAAALKRGSRDNLTAVVARYNSQG